MTKRDLLTLSLMVAALAPTCEGGQTAIYPVEVVFRDAPGDRIRSDGLGPYVEGIDKVRAQIIDDRGRLVLFACATSSKDKIRCPGPRGMVLDFGDLATDVLGTAADPGPTSVGLPFVSSLVDSLYVEVNLVDANGDHLADGLLGMTEVGEHVAAGMKGNFLDQDGNLYTIRLSPKVTTDSNWVLVTYLGGQIPCDETTSCASWTVEAWTGSFTGAPMCCPTYDLYDIGTLLSDNTNDEGDYHLPFLMTITALPQSGGGAPGGGHGKRGNGK